MIFYPYWRYIMWIKILDELTHFFGAKEVGRRLVAYFEGKEPSSDCICNYMSTFTNLFKYFPIRCVVQIFFHQMRKLIRLLNNFWNLALFCNIGEGNAFHNAVNIFPKWLNQFADNGQFVCDIGAFNALLVVIILHVLLAA